MVPPAMNVSLGRRTALILLLIALPGALAVVGWGIATRCQRRDLAVLGSIARLEGLAERLDVLADVAVEEGEGKPSDDLRATITEVDGRLARLRWQVQADCGIRGWRLAPQSAEIVSAVATDWHRVRPPLLRISEGGGGGDAGVEFTELRPRLTALAVSVFALQDTYEEGFDRSRRASLAVLSLCAFLQVAANGIAIGVVRRQMVHPLGAVTEGARRLTAGDLAARVEPGGNREVRLLGETFNEMADSIEGLLDAQERAGAALRASEERFRALAEHADDLVFRYRLVAPRGFDYVSPSSTSVVGYTPDEHYSNPDLGAQIIHPADSNKLRTVLLEGGRAILRWRHKAGHTVWTEVQCVPVRDPAGRTVASEGIARDVTERSRAERQLLQFAQIIQQTHDAVVCTDLDGRIIAWNTGAELLLGYAASEIVGQFVGVVYFPEDHGHLFAQFSGALWREGRCEGEVRLRHRSGECRWVHLSVSTLSDEDGRPQRVVGHALDLTARRRAESALQREKAHFEQLFMALPEAAVLVDQSGQIVRVNPCFLALFDLRGEDVIGRRLHDLVVPPMLRDEAAAPTETAVEGTPVERECVRQRRDGSLVPVSVLATPIRVHGQEVGAYVIYRDISARVSYQDELRRLSAHLLTSQDEERRRIARELHDGVAQTVSAAAMGLERLAVLGSPPDRTALTVEVAGLLEAALSEIRTASYLLHPPFLDESGLSSALAWFVEGFARRSRIRMRLRVPELARLGDAIELTIFRVVQEALANVHRHSQSQVASVVVCIRPGRVCLAIVDRGRGIPAPILAAWRAGRPIGVGLSGMRERVRQLGGAIELDSRPGRTVVRVVLPV